MEAAARHFESQCSRVMSGRGSGLKFRATVLKTLFKHKLKTGSLRNKCYLWCSHNRGLLSRRFGACTRWLCAGDSAAVPKAVFWVAWLASISTNLVASWVQCCRPSRWGGGSGSGRGESGWSCSVFFLLKSWEFCQIHIQHRPITVPLLILRVIVSSCLFFVILLFLFLYHLLLLFLLSFTRVFVSIYCISFHFIPCYFLVSFSLAFSIFFLHMCAVVFAFLVSSLSFLPSFLKYFLSICFLFFIFFVTSRVFMRFQVSCAFFLSPFVYWFIFGLFFHCFFVL